MSEDDSPTSRALKVLDLLQRHPGITALQLADRLGVTDRAARRYVAVLREADIAIESGSGRYGGYRLGRGLRLPPLVFSSTEALGLVMAALAGRQAIADDGDPVGAALSKIMRALPPEVARKGELMREHARSAPGRGSVRPEPVIASDLVVAEANRRQVRIGYRSASGSTYREVVDPWAVVVRHGLWYLLCFAHTAEDVRAYRIDRITGVELLEASFERPSDLDPIAALERHLGSGWPFDTSVLFHAPYATIAAWVAPAMGQLEPVSAQRCRLRGSTNNPQMYAGEWLAGIPHDFTVEGGPELIAAVDRLARRFTAANPAYSE